MIRKSSFAARLTIVLTCIVASAVASAQQVPTDPSSTHIFPAGGRRGTAVAVRVGGECIPPKTRFRLWQPNEQSRPRAPREEPAALSDGQTLTAPAELGERITGRYAPSPRRKPSEQPVNHPTEWGSRIDIADDAPLGSALWRLSCARGGTGGRPFIIGDLPEFIESEPNSVPEEAQQVEMPVTINGQIAGECDLDYFRFHASAGDVVHLDMAAARLGSALDPIVQILDTDGHRIAAQELRVGADPILAFRAEVSGDYQLLISGVTYRGGPAHVYRITLSSAPFVRFAFPAGGQAGTTQLVDFFSMSGDGTLTAISQSVTFPSTSGPIWSRSGDGGNPVLLTAGDLTESVETPNNDSRQSATELLFPQLINAQLESPTDEDWYRLTCRAGTSLSIACQAQPGWSSALPIVALVDANGGIVSTVSSVQVSGPTTRLHWSPPAEGVWWLRVRDLQQGIRGGPDFTYRLSVRESVPEFALTMKTDAVNVVQGARAEVDVTIEHVGGFSSPMELIVEGLPEGVTLEGHLIAAGQTSAKLAFIASEDARSTDVTLRIRGKADVAGVLIERPVRAVHLGHDPDGIGLGESDVDHVQLTVVHKPVFRLYCNEAYQYAHRGTIYPYLMEVERLNGFDQPIHLEVADRQIKDLDGIEIPKTTIAPEQSQLLLPLYLPETMHINVQAHSNVYAQGHVEFVDKFGQPQSMLVVSTMRCMIRTLPTVVKLRSLEQEYVANGDGPVTCSLALDRTPNFTGHMQIRLVDPPPGLSAEATTIRASEHSADLTIQVAGTMPPSSSVPLRFQAVGMMDDDVQVVSEATATLVFQSTHHAPP